MSKPRLLDLFCGAGGAARGYQLAGLYVVGVDINPQPHYCGDEFIQADVMQLEPWALQLYDAVHASPPCQAYTRAKAVHRKAGHPDLVAPTRELLRSAGVDYVIENVELAPLDAQLMLCGSMFGLRIRRHRYFETNLRLPLAPMDCVCRGLSAQGFLFNPYNTEQRNRYMKRFGYTSIAVALREAMDISWMPSGGGASRKRGATGDISNAIPPAYTEWIGRQLLASLKAAA